MNLKVQIISLAFSFVFGVFYVLLLKISGRVLFSSKWLISILGSLFFNIFLSLVYFLLLNMINNGMLHVYFLFIFLLGCYSGYLILKWYGKKRCQV